LKVEKSLKSESTSGLTTNYVAKTVIEEYFNINHIKESATKSSKSFQEKPPPPAEEEKKNPDFGSNVILILILYALYKYFLC
jgi:hypothetical protein